MQRWDSHAHVIGDARLFPFANGRGYTPQPAPLESYLAMLDRHELAHGVLVQPSVYGNDHRCLIDALDRAGGRLFGIAVPSPDATRADLEALHQHGVRGVRCNIINPGGLAIAAVMSWSDVLRALGWHVEAQVRLADVPETVNHLRGLGVPIVIDHMGRPTSVELDPDSGGAKALIDLVRAGECYVKLSAPYRASAVGPLWRDVARLARALVAADAGHCLWGSDWPHTDMPLPVTTDDVIAALAEWCPDEASRTLVTSSAARLFVK
jgi:predicted TIM-barrel fold metal-dependent hydrolase